MSISKRIAWFLLCAGMCVGTAVAQSQEPEVTEQPPPRPSGVHRVFFGGSVGAAFGTVESVAIAPLVGFHVVPRLDLGVQPYYRWVRDGRYDPTISTTDYGFGTFARVPIVHGLFAEADYQYTNYEYATAPGLTTRATHNAFLVGGGYTIPAGGHVGVYMSALYDLTYDGNDPYRPYDSPVRFQVGVAVGF